MSDPTPPNLPRARKGYTDEFKSEAVRLATREAVNRTELARDLGIDASMLYRWIKKALRPQQSSDQASPGSVETQLRQAQQRIRLLEMERDILKKATAYFAREQP